MVVQLAFRVETRLVTKRAHTQILRQLNGEMMEKIRDEFWPKHFMNVPETYPGAGGYHYARRTAKYQERKLRKYGHNLPLVYTGAFRATIQSAATITKTANSATLKSHCPHFIRLRNKREAEAVSEREKIELTQWYGRRYVECCNSPEFQEKKVRVPVAI